MGLYLLIMCVHGHRTNDLFQFELLATINIALLFRSSDCNNSNNSNNKNQDNWSQQCLQWFINSSDDKAKTAPASKKE